MHSPASTQKPSRVHEVAVHRAADELHLVQELQLPALALFLHRAAPRTRHPPLITTGPATGHQHNLEGPGTLYRGVQWCSNQLEGLAFLPATPRHGRSKAIGWGLCGPQAVAPCMGIVLYALPGSPRPHPDLLDGPIHGDRVLSHCLHLVTQCLPSVTQ